MWITIRAHNRPLSATRTRARRRLSPQAIAQAENTLRFLRARAPHVIPSGYYQIALTPDPTTPARDVDTADVIV